MVFLVLYVAVSLAIGDFYVMPITVALMAASGWALCLYGGHTLTERIYAFSRAATEPDIMYMIWIFVTAGSFAALAKGIGAIDATVCLTLQVFPSALLLPAIFIAACFISLAIGTSVGTIVAVVPLVVELAAEGGGNVPLFVATALGGAFFGDNLSFISDTTIAATRTQGCSMAGKFKANLRIVMPACAIALGVYIFIGSDITLSEPEPCASAWLMIPYLVVIAAALCGVNVLLVLVCGIVTAIVAGCVGGTVNIMGCATLMGEGVKSMGELIIITLLASGMLGLIKAMGGVDFLLARLSGRVRGPRGAQACIGGVVSLVNLCTANNTIAIISVGSLARNIAHEYGISPRRSASILDTCSCVVQSLIPYGAQTLLATGLASISPAAPWPYLYYPWALAAMVALAIVLPSKKTEQ